MGKKTFDFKSQIKTLFDGNSESDIKVWVCNISDTLFSIAQENAGKKFDLVYTESDFLKFGKTITGALKRACAEFSTLLIEDKGFDHSKNKSFFNFSGEIVLVVGGYDLISITSHYASLLGKDVYVILTEPCAEYLLINKARILANGLYALVDINPPKVILIDIDVLNKAPVKAFQESFINVMSKLVTLIDYKFRVLITGAEFDVKSYQNVKNAISLVAGVNAYENRKEVLIYAEAVLAVERMRSNLLLDGAVELYQDALGMFSSALNKGDKLLTATRVIVELYEMLFTNDLSNLLSVADYNRDINFLEKTTGKTGSYFRKNLNIPSPRRLEIINKIINKTRSGFQKEVESVLFVLSAIEKVYNSFYNKTEPSEEIPLSTKREALLVATYLSDKLTILSHMRDMGVLRCIYEN